MKKRLFKKQTYADVFDRIIDIAFLLAGILIIFELISISASALLRKFTGISVTVVEPANEYSLLYITFLAAPWLLKKEHHVMIEIVTDLCGPSTKAVLFLLTSIAGTALFLCMTWFGFQNSLYQWAHGVTDFFKLENFPEANITIIIPIGSLLLSIQFMRRTYGAWKTLRQPGMKSSAEGNTESAEYI